MTAVLEVQGLTVRFAGEAALSSVSLSLAAWPDHRSSGREWRRQDDPDRAIIGLERCDEGTVAVAGTAVDGLSAERRARLGIGYCPEGRRVFPGMTVRENLEVASTEAASARRARLDDVAQLFPALGERADVQRLDAVRRTAADAGHRAGADGATASFVAGRAKPGTGAGPDPTAFRHRATDRR